MSLFDFQEAIKLRRADVPFHALIMAAAMKADTENTLKIQVAWPEVWAESNRRYNAPGGVLPEDSQE